MTPRDIKKLAPGVRLIWTDPTTRKPSPPFVLRTFEFITEGVRLAVRNAEGQIQEMICQPAELSEV